jgi:hypothetical protein
LRQQALVQRFSIAACLVPIVCCLIWKISLGAKGGCETCHTDKAALRNSLSPIQERSGEEEES